MRRPFCLAVGLAVGGCGGAQVVESDPMLPPLYDVPRCPGTVDHWAADDTRFWRPYWLEPVGADGRLVAFGLSDASIAIRGERARVLVTPPDRPRHGTGCALSFEAGIMECEIIETEEGIGFFGDCRPYRVVRGTDGWSLDIENAPWGRLEDGSPSLRAVTFGQLTAAEMALVDPCERVSFLGIPAWYAEAAAEWLGSRGIAVNWELFSARDRAQVSCAILQSLHADWSVVAFTSVSAVEQGLVRVGEGATVHQCRRRVAEYEFLGGAH